MSPRDSLYPEDWRKVAREDWHRIRVMLDVDDATGSGFFLQQSVEKYLKAYLLTKEWKLKKLHDLALLLEDACDFDPSLTEFYDLCEKVTGFYLTERYPSLGDSGLELSEIQDLLPESQRLITRLFSDEMPD